MLLLPPAGPGRSVQVCLALTSDLLLQTEDDGDGLVQDQQLGLRLVALQVELHHPAQLLERLVDVADAQPLPGVVGHPALPLPLHLLLRAQILVVVVAGVTKEENQRREGGDFRIKEVSLNFQGLCRRHQVKAKTF